MKNEKILVVEDNPVNLKMLTQALAKSNYDIIEAMNGTDAIRAAESHKPDLILLDVIIPRKNGFKVCQNLKRNEETKHIPIIFITAKDAPVDKVKGLALGANDYITKPYDMVEVMARVRAQLRIQSLHNELIQRNRQLEKAYLGLKAQAEEKIRDIKAAGQVQRRLLPQNDRTIGPLHFAWKFIPCSHVAGDIFNFMQIDENHVAVFIIDVSGHGVQAAMLAVQIHNYLKSTHSFNFNTKKATGNTLYDPVHILKELNKTFSMDIFDAYFTAIYMVINIKTLQAQIVNAGHPYPLLIHNDKSYEFIEQADIPLGMMEKIDHETFSMQFKKGERLILYTDGLLEIPVAGTTFLPRQKIVEYILESGKDHQGSLEYLTEKIISQSRQTEFNDDVSIFGIEFE